MSSVGADADPMRELPSIEPERLAKCSQMPVAELSDLVQRMMALWLHSPPSTSSGSESQRRPVMDSGRVVSAAIEICPTGRWLASVR